MNRLLIVSNRLPVTIERAKKGFRAEVSSGGLVTALQSVIRRRPSCWIGWPGTTENQEIRELLMSGSMFEKCRMVPVFLSETERHEFYSGFCNEILWPLFHDLQSRCNFEPGYWRRYREVNGRFSEAIFKEARAEDIVWVHDYHLLLQGGLLSSRMNRQRLGYFHHIPFPPPDVFEKLPWRQEILESMLAFGTLGFQTRRDRRNFLACVRRFFPQVESKKSGDCLQVHLADKETRVGAFPIGIDFEEFAAQAANAETAAQAEQIRKNLRGCRVVLGVDRLDYTKGIPERLKAFRELLSRSPEFHHKVSLIQIVVPSREDIPNYQELKVQVERLVSEINGHFGGPSWVPIHYLHRHLSRPELVAYYRAADVALITPLKDGMNLVAKEFCASQLDERGVLILSEFAGTADQLREGALLVNPYDTESVAATLERALRMEETESRPRMRRMRRSIQASNVFGWCEAFLQSHAWVPGDSQEDAESEGTAHFSEAWSTAIELPARTGEM